MIGKGIVAIGLSAFLIVVGAVGGVYIGLREPPSHKSYDYEFQLSGAAIYVFEYDKKVNVDATSLDYFITHETGVEPVGISVAFGWTAFSGKEVDGQYTRITIHMPEEVNEALLKNVVEKVISGEYTLSASEHDYWGIYVKEKRKYPTIDAHALEEFIEEKLGINPIGVSTSGVRVIIHMPQPVNGAQLEVIVNEFLQQKGIKWMNFGSPS